MIKVAFIHLTRSPRLPEHMKRELPGIPPLWAFSLASYLKEAVPNIKLEIIDNQLLGFEEIFSRIKKGKFDVVALSPEFNNYKETLEVARFSKKYGSKVVLGGIHATPLRKEIIQNRGSHSSDYCVDALVQQDGEKALFKYVSGKPLSQINNLVYQEKHGKIKENPVKLLDLDDLPLINYRLVDFKKYFHLQLPRRKYMATYLSHRGCPWRERGLGCVFCALLDKKARFKSPKKIWYEIKKLKSLYGIKYFFDTGDDFLSSKEWFEEICRIAPTFKNPPQLWIYSRSSSINPKTIKLLKKINVGLVMLGIESLDSRTLGRLKYGLTVNAHKKAISLLFKSGILPRVNMVIGAPGESKETLASTIKQIKLLPSRVIAPIAVNFLTPFPGSPAWELLLAKEKKYRGQDLMDGSELANDWAKHFCKVSANEIVEALKQISGIRDVYKLNS